MNGFPLIAAALAAFLFFFFGFRIVLPDHRGIVESFGKYSRPARPGIHWVFPAIARIVQISVAEQMVDAGPQNILTGDERNARVDARIFFRVLPDEASVKAYGYGAGDRRLQIADLARGVLCRSIGGMPLESANRGRSRINADLHRILIRETRGWGIAVLRTELKGIDMSLYLGQ